MEFFRRVVQYEGKSFADLKVFKKDNAHKKGAWVRRASKTRSRYVWPRYRPVISRKLTFEEAIQDAAFSIT